MNTPKATRDFDVRIRDRNVKKGLLTEKDVEAYLNALPDVEANYETISLAQPALSGASGGSNTSGTNV